MTCRVSHTSFDCANAYELAEWWKQVLGYTDLPDDPNEPGDEECMIRSADGSHFLLFIEVPDFDPGIKKRIHLDLRPTDRRQGDEVDRLLGIGARQIVDRRGIYGPGSGWVVLADPAGNEFCVLRSDEERAQAQT